MLLSDDIVCIVIATVLAGGWSLMTMALPMLLHRTTLHMFTTAEGAWDEDIVACPLLGIKVSL